MLFSFDSVMFYLFTFGVFKPTLQWYISYKMGISSFKLAAHQKSTSP